jgi:hypothetical protein
MSTRDDAERVELLQGTLDLLILRTLEAGPALHRLIKRDWISVEEGTSENNRRAKFYGLTAQDRNQLMVETTKWERLARAIAGILRPASEEGGAMRMYRRVFPNLRIRHK